MLRLLLWAWGIPAMTGGNSYTGMAMMHAALRPAGVRGFGTKRPCCS
jgi:hypothetical protein